MQYVVCYVHCGLYLPHFKTCKGLDDEFYHPLTFSYS